MFHKEGFKIITITMFILAIGVITADKFIVDYWTQKAVQIVFLVFAILVLQFFRNPKRNTILNDSQIMAPVDGEVVVVEEVNESEYFKDKRRQISIFMTPLNVHVTRYPISGKVVFSKYHEGKYLIASHPKSSTENERTTVVVENDTIGKILYRQVAGALARRIVNYAKVGDKAIQGADAGFIKFGSRADIYIPLDFEVNVKLGDKVTGGEQVIAQKS